MGNFLNQSRNEMIYQKDKCITYDIDPYYAPVHSLGMKNMLQMEIRKGKGTKQGNTSPFHRLSHKPVSGRQR